MRTNTLKMCCLSSFFSFNEYSLFAMHVCHTALAFTAVNTVDAHIIIINNGLNFTIIFECTFWIMKKKNKSSIAYLHWHFILLTFCISVCLIWYANVAFHITTTDFVYFSSINESLYDFNGPITAIGKKLYFKTRDQGKKN